MLSCGVEIWGYPVISAHPDHLVRGRFLPGQIMAVVVRGEGRYIVAGSQLDDSVLVFVEIFRRVTRVDHQLGRRGNLANVIGAVIGENNDTIVFGDFGGSRVDRF